MYNPFSLEGKTVLVTGASSGIGRGTAIECSKMGAKIVLSGRNEKRLQETLSQLQGDEHLVMPADVTSSSALNILVDKTPELHGVVHCAGISQIKMVRFMDEDSLNTIFSNNVIGPLLLNTLLLKKRKIKKGSSIVFISSISGVYATQLGEAGYGASKAALAGYMKAAAVELASKGIRVNCIHPGVIETPLLKTSTETFSEENLDDLKKKYPLKQFGKPEDVALCAVYLLSGASSFMTGSSILLDGGFSLS